MEVGLPARLRSFGYGGRFSSSDNVYGPLLANHAWPQLRCLKWGDNGPDALLDAVLARPAVVFPQLETLDCKLYGIHARKLLMLVDRGAFPSLASSHGSGGSFLMARDSATGLAQQMAILRRLPAIEALDLAINVALAPFSELITSSGLSSLKCVRACLDVHFL